jgi:hypothetical protein
MEDIKSKVFALTLLANKLSKGLLELQDELNRLSAEVEPESISVPVQATKAKTEKEKAVVFYNACVDAYKSNNQRLKRISTKKKAEEYDNIPKAEQKIVLGMVKSDKDPCNIPILFDYCFAVPYANNPEWQNIETILRHWDKHIDAAINHSVHSKKQHDYNE